MAPPARPHDLLMAALGAAAAGLLVGAPWLVDRSGPDPFYKGPLIFPLIALALMVAASLPSALRLARGRGGGWRVDGHGVPWRGIRVFAVMAPFPLAVGVVGLQASTFAFTAAGLWLAGYRRPGAGLVAAIVATALIHLAFRSFLDVWFPSPLVLDWLG